ncbi:hypothetical protein C900_00702 [Fulvivirga imtechensis AK7]|uniref:Uncharacterized protein n=1 Tax=Fulvivirga imtechensis AK7 TaxID=1237149 RepID=L8JL01_9BACT|nr:hypothetical protein C900_00702 [Fulvivirga imtechensis AK7]
MARQLEVYISGPLKKQKVIFQSLTVCVIIHNLIKNENTQRY